MITNSHLKSDMLLSSIFQYVSTNQFVTIYAYIRL